MLFFSKIIQFEKIYRACIVFNGRCEKGGVTSEDEWSRQFHNLPAP
jgi:hypothetical protein